MGVSRWPCAATKSVTIALCAALAVSASGCGPDAPDVPNEPGAGPALEISAVASSPPITVGYPQDTGVLLGQGWNSFSITPGNAVCIVFQEAQAQQGQRKNMSLKSVTSDFELQRSFGMDASVQYKAAVVSGGAKASFVETSDMKTSNSNISVYAIVDNGPDYVAPPLATQADQIASLIRAGKSSAEINKALNISAAQVDQRWRQTLTPKANPSIEDSENENMAAVLNAAAAADPSYRAIALHPDYVEMAANDLDQFRRTCGDRYVQSISKGGEAIALYSFETKSLAKQQEIKASLEGSGWGVTAEGSAQSKVASLSKKAKLTIQAQTTGGSGEDFPTDLDGFYASIRAFPAAVAKAPWSYNISLADYRGLPNWPKAEMGQPDFDAMKTLAFHHAKWRTLQRELGRMLDQPSGGLGLSQAYLLGRGVTRDTLLKMEDLARTNKDALTKTIGGCLEKTDGNTPCQPGERLQTMASSQPGPLSSDYDLLTQLPLPISSGPMLQKERLMSASALKEALFQFWVKRTWDERCALEPGNEAICLRRPAMEALKSKINVPTANPLLLVSLIGKKSNCASVNTSKNTVNWSTCNPAETAQQWAYNSTQKTFKNVATKTCLNVRGSKTGDKARLIVYSCGKNEAYKNDRWTLKASKHGAWMLKAGHASSYCLSTRPGAFKNAMQLGLKACTRDGESSWNQVNWVIVSGKTS